MMDESPNEFYSYGINEDNGGYYVTVYDLERDEHDILFTKSHKVAKHLVEYFDNLAMDEEIELFKGIAS